MSLNPAITISQATVEDLEELSRLFDQYRIFYGEKSDVPGARAFLFDKFVHLESVIFKAQDEQPGRLVGFTQLYPVYSSISMRKSWILNDLFVLEEFRRNGAARMLLKRAADYAALTGARGIELSTSISNAAAQRLYESLGFIKDEHYFHYHLTL
ncbi:GNAT family N-acetyltransferase [Paenibacillus pinistramenti]|uniref:GNAT family N-acetyltransferase n=1 Tax=Paenibacillus pinistramenti TaxID=1768003 RepID=UPI001EF05EAD|nr:GNAT family N-acetyltransferase [Paenibacillus pinistramenti]